MQLNSISCPAAMFNRMAEVTKLLFKAARVRVEFTKEGWQQLLRLHPYPMSAFIQTVNIKADLGLYIASYEERGIHLDSECQEVCYQSGLFLILRKEHGVWYVTDVYTTGEDAGFVPVYFWTPGTSPTCTRPARTLALCRCTSGRGSSVAAMCWRRGC